MVEIVLTINDKDGSYAEHAGVVLAAIFSNTREKINVHIVHDDSLSEDSKAKLRKLTDAFSHGIHFYLATVPDDLLATASGVHKIEYWTMASMYRLLLPLIIPADRVIYLDCDIFVNMDINELWSIDLGDRFLAAVKDQGQNIGEYAATIGLDGEQYFNSGVILFHLNHIRNHTTWYSDMLSFMSRFPMITMPDQDVLNAIYGTNYLQLDLRFNTFAHGAHDVSNKIAHFAGDAKWWKPDSPAITLYNKYLAMTPWSNHFRPSSKVIQVAKGTSVKRSRRKRRRRLRLRLYRLKLKLRLKLRLRLKRKMLARKKNPSSKRRVLRRRSRSARSRLRRIS